MTDVQIKWKTINSREGADHTFSAGITRAALQMNLQPLQIYLQGCQMDLLPFQFEKLPFGNILSPDVLTEAVAQYL